MTVQPLIDFPMLGRSYFRVLYESLGVGGALRGENTLNAEVWSSCLLENAQVILSGVMLTLLVAGSNIFTCASLRGIKYVSDFEGSASAGRDSATR